MILQIVSVVVLVAAFVIAAVRGLNLGAIALVATFGVGSLAAGLSTADTFDGFPGSTVVVIVGVTYLFNLADANGTIDWLVAASVRAVRGRTLLIPWIMFLASGVLCAIGAIYSVAILAPVALGFATRHRLSRFMVGAMLVHGWAAGALSPISLFGIIVDGVLDSSGLPSHPLQLFAIGIAVNTAIAVIVFAVLAGRRLLSAGPVGVTQAGVAQAGVAEVPADEQVARFTWQTGLSLAAFAVLMIGAVLGLDVGLTAVSLAVLMGLISSRHHAAALAAVPWSVVLMVAGVLTYVGVLEQIGTIDTVGGMVAAIGAPLAAALVLAYIGGVISAFASSTAVITAMIPLAVPLLQSSRLSELAVVATLAVAIIIVDVSPFSVNGAMLVANTEPDQRDVMLRDLLRYGALITAAAPLLVWLTVVVPSGST